MVEGSRNLGDSELFGTRLGAPEGADADGDDARLLPEELGELEGLELGLGLLGALL